MHINQLPHVNVVTNKLNFLYHDHFNNITVWPETVLSVHLNVQVLKFLFPFSQYFFCCLCHSVSTFYSFTSSDLSNLSQLLFCGLINLVSLSEHCINAK